MKDAKKNISDIISKIKELKKTAKGRAVLFFGAYFIFFLVLAILARTLPRSVTSYDDIKNNHTNYSISADLILNNNFKFTYSVNIDGVLYNYVGERKNTQERFTYNNLEYYKSGDNYLVNNNGIWTKCDSPYYLSDFLEFSKVNELFSDATYISKTEFESGEASYNFKIATANIVEKLDKINIDIEEIPNEIVFVTNSDGEVYNVQLVLNSYGKYKGYCQDVFSITLNYSDFGQISEIVNPID